MEDIFVLNYPGVQETHPRGVGHGTQDLLKNNFIQVLCAIVSIAWKNAKQNRLMLWYVWKKFKFTKVNMLYKSHNYHLIAKFSPNPHKAAANTK